LQVVEALESTGIRDARQFNRIESNWGTFFVRLACNERIHMNSSYLETFSLELYG